MILISYYLLLDQRNGDTQRETEDLLNFHLRRLAMSEIAPFFKGFCGDSLPGVEQKAGGIQSPLRTANTSELSIL
jgi:hypothetical protein